jgi:hypothetical protein
MYRGRLRQRGRVRRVSQRPQLPEHPKKYNLDVTIMLNFRSHTRTHAHTPLYPPLLSNTCVLLHPPTYIQQPDTDLLSNFPPRE